MRRQLAALVGSGLLAATPFDQHALAVAQVASASQQVLSISTHSAGPAVAAQAGQAMAPKKAPYIQTWRYSDFLTEVEENRVTQVCASCPRLLHQRVKPPARVRGA